MSRYFNVSTGGLILTVLFTGCRENKKIESKPNILWIIADDLGTDLGCYGEKSVMTPNLDNLARQGVRYSDFHSVVPVSSPSRSALITGMYPCSIGCQQHRTITKKPLPEGIYPVTHYFRNAGYFTSNCNYQNINKPGKEDYNFIAENIFDGTDWSQRTEGQPFFAQIQIHYPHRAFEADSLCPVDPASVEIPPVYPDHPLTRKDWALYLESVQHVDKIVGQILQRLEDEGLEGNTVVMFFGDQGQPHVKAKQFLYDCGTHTPLIIRYPDGKAAGTVNSELVCNIDLAPACMRLAGIELPEYIQGQDFISEDHKSRDIIFSQRDRMDGTTDRMRALRTKDYRYIWNAYPERPYSQFNAYKKEQYPVLTLMEMLHEQGKLTPEQDLFFSSKKPVEELYYLPDDLFQTRNLAGDSRYEKKLVEFRNIIREWINENDKGIYPEPSAETDSAVSLMMKNHQLRMEQMGLSPGSSHEEIIEYWMKRYNMTSGPDNRKKMSLTQLIN